MIKFNLKTKLDNNQKVIGGFLSIYNTSLIEMVGLAGFDFIVIDTEHGSFSNNEVAEIIKICKLTNITPIVRVVNDNNQIQKYLDSGAYGLQIPMVNNKEEALKIINDSKFPPLGNRGVSYSIPAANYGYLKGREYLNNMNENILTVVQIETYEAVKNFDDIINVLGIDVVFLGTTDLAVNLGLDNPSHPKVIEIVETLKRKAHKNNVKFGVVANDESSVNDALENDIDYTVVVLNSLINNAFKNIVSVRDCYE